MTERIQHDEITDENTPLPLSLFFLEEMPMPAQMTRLCVSESAHAPQYECEAFYKAISRPFKTPRKKGAGDAK